MSKTSTIGGVMRKVILIVLLLVVPHSFAFAPNAPDQRAIDAFLKTQNDKTDPVSDAFLKTQNDKTDLALNAQISELMQAGYTERGPTGAVALGGGCGFVGCNSTSLVTTVYFTRGANTQSRIVAAIVTNPIGREFRVGRILTRTEIERLVNPK